MDTLPHCDVRKRVKLKLAASSCFCYVFVLFLRTEVLATSSCRQQVGSNVLAIKVFILKVVQAVQ